MSRTTAIKDPEQIPIILDIIHDCWFDKDDIIFDPEASILKFKFKRKVADKKEVISKVLFVKKIKVSTIECFLNIYHVKDYVLKDEAKVGNYDFNELIYDPESKQISITTGVPIDIEIMTDQFEVSVEETDKILEEKISLSF